MSIAAEFDLAVEEEQLRVQKIVVTSFSDIKRNSPKDSGEFMDAWELIQKGEFTWQMYNPQEYGGILANGRITIGGKTYGSTMGWGLHGLTPEIMKLEKELRE